MASVFVMDLATGDNFALNDGVAFSGMSLTKIAILAALVVATVGLSFYLNYAINGDIMRTNYHAAWGEGNC